MNLIVCVDSNNGIGFNNDLLFNLPSDKTFFKTMTTKNVVVMGKNTFLSLPSGALPNRTNIVLSTTLEREDCVICKNIQELFSQLKKYPSENIFVIGGEEIYALLADYCHTAYVTKVKAEKMANRFFVDLDNAPNWEQVSQTDVFTENGNSFYFTLYKNKNVIPLEEGI